MNIAHSVQPQLVAYTACWMMKRLLAASPMHYSAWSPDSERRRMEVLVEILSRRDTDPRIPEPVVPHTAPRRAAEASAAAAKAPAAKQAPAGAAVDGRDAPAPAGVSAQRNAVPE